MRTWVHFRQCEILYNFIFYTIYMKLQFIIACRLIVITMYLFNLFSLLHASIVTLLHLLWQLLAVVHYSLDQMYVDPCDPLWILNCLFSFTLYTSREISSSSRFCTAQFLLYPFSISLSTTLSGLVKQIGLTTIMSANS